MTDEQSRQQAGVDAFVRTVRARRCLWGLESADGFAVCESGLAPGTGVMPFWSGEELATRHAVGEWSGYRAVAIDLDEFLEHWTLGLAGDGYLVGIEWDASLEGAEVEAEVLEEMLLGER
ncbi:MAG: DUF2750 domain-containing protein [Chromatiales bacterium]|nr:DUF2750 domain-containing protein [Gammaproteobacteria bacterium]MCP5351641.1 DUF2750 domain-containing protein [Chromatiales bacterium]